MSTEKEQTTMSTIHPIHPTFQFEAKHAMRFLDNLLQSSTSIIDMPRVEQEVRKITTEDKKVDEIMAIMANAYNNNHKRGVTP